MIDVAFHQHSKQFAPMAVMPALLRVGNDAIFENGGKPWPLQT